MINKLTGEPVSKEMLNVLDQLKQGKEVSRNTIDNLKEMKEAYSRVSQDISTHKLDNRKEIQTDVLQKLQNMGSAVTKSNGAVSFSGDIICDKRLDIIIGLPAAGKSSALAEPISEGYKVYVHLNDLDKNKALGRMINRFLETGRFINPDLITKYGNSIENTYQTLKNSNIIDGYSKWSNDVPLGYRPKLIECSDSCKDMCTALSKPTVAEQLDKSKDTCKVLCDKINEVNAVLRSNPKLLAEYVKNRDELRQKKAELTKKGDNITENKHKPHKSKI